MKPGGSTSGFFAFKKVFGFIKTGTTFGRATYIAIKSAYNSEHPEGG
jgi:hypothetical protein